MARDEKAILERDLRRDVWQEALDSVRDIKSGNIGAVSTVNVPPVVEARSRTGLSQLQFAELLGVSVRTLQDWEQGRRQPSRAAASLIRIARERPEVLREVFG